MVLQDRAVKSATSRYPSGGKIFEWFSAIELAAFGLSLLHPSKTFSIPAYAGFEELGMTELTAGLITLSVGLIWCAALWINGRMRISPRVRMACSICGGGLWGGVTAAFSLSYYETGIFNTAILCYGIMALFSFFTSKRAARDAFYA